MDQDRFLGFLFVFYCLTVGIVLVVIPWTPGWDRMLAHIPVAGLDFLKLPVLRGGLSGFGLVHLMWAAHDLLRLLHSDHGSGHARSETAGHQ